MIEYAPPATPIPSGTVPGSSLPALTPPAPPDSLRMRVLSILILALVACAAVAHGWRAGRVFVPTDALKLAAPWKAPTQEYIAKNEQLLDQTVQFVPWMNYTIERYKEKQIPLWNPYAGIGQPFLANGQSAVFYPTVLLHYWMPETWSWTLSAALRLFVAGLGLWVLVGRYGLRGGPRLLAGIAFMICGFNIVWLNHPQMNVMPLLPWAVLVVELLLERVTLLRIIAGSIVFALQFLGGHPATSVHLLLTCGLVAIGRLIWPVGTGLRVGISRWLGGILSAALVIVLGFALSAVQWLPLIEYAQHSGAKIVREDRLAEQREKIASAQGAMGKVMAEVRMMDARHLVGLLFPYANGYAPDGISPFEAMRQGTHLPNTNELAAGFVGTIPLLLAGLGLLGFRRRGSVKLWFIVALIAGAIAIKFPGIEDGVRQVPALNVAQNARLLGVVAMALAIFAGFGLQSLMQRVAEGGAVARLGRNLKWAAIIVASLAIIAAATTFFLKGWIIRTGYERADATYDKVAQHENSKEVMHRQVDRVYPELLLTSARLLIPAAMLAGAWLLLRRAQRARDQAGQGEQLKSIALSPWPWLGLAAVDLLAFAIPYNPGAGAETYPDRISTTTPAIQKLHELPPYRLAGTYRTLMPELGTAFGLADLRSYDALAPERYYLWWDHEGIGDLPPAAQGYLSRLETYDKPAWKLLNFGYLITGSRHRRPPENEWKLVNESELINESEDAAIYQAVNIRPRAWIAGKAEVMNTVDEVLDRVAKMDFNPDQLVLLDGDVPAKVVASSIVATQARVDFIAPKKPEDDRPEVVRMRVTGAGGGWLVLADSFTPGWTATIVNESTGVGRDETIYPAYGALRAIPLANTDRGAAYIVELRYRPMGWRVGVMTSALAGAVRVLLIGAAIFGRVWPRRSVLNEGVS